MIILCAVPYFLHRAAYMQLVPFCIFHNDNF
jgi:hypothetical protein